MQGRVPMKRVSISGGVMCETNAARAAWRLAPAPLSPLAMCLRLSTASSKLNCYRGKDGAQSCMAKVGWVAKAAAAAAAVAAAAGRGRGGLGRTVACIRNNMRGFAAHLCYTRDSPSPPPQSAVAGLLAAS